MQFQKARQKSMISKNPLKHACGRSSSSCKLTQQSCKMPLAVTPDCQLPISGFSAHGCCYLMKSSRDTIQRNCWCFSSLQPCTFRPSVISCSFGFWVWMQRNIMTDISLMIWRIMPFLLDTNIAVLIKFSSGNVLTMDTNCGLMSNTRSTILTHMLEISTLHMCLKKCKLCTVSLARVGPNCIHQQEGSIRCTSE